jgi:tRNA U54 and U55 pseudouridine synthase Pus10
MTNDRFSDARNRPLPAEAAAPGKTTLHFLLGRVRDLDQENAGLRKRLQESHDIVAAEGKAKAEALQKQADVLREWELKLLEREQAVREKISHMETAKEEMRRELARVVEQYRGSKP